MKQRKSQIKYFNKLSKHKTDHKIIWDNSNIYAISINANSLYLVKEKKHLNYLINKKILYKTQSKAKGVGK